MVLVQAVDSAKTSWTEWLADKQQVGINKPAVLLHLQTSAHAPMPANMPSPGSPAPWLFRSIS